MRKSYTEEKNWLLKATKKSKWENIIFVEPDCTYATDGMRVHITKYDLDLEVGIYRFRGKGLELVSPEEVEPPMMETLYKLNLKLVGHYPRRGVVDDPMILYHINKETESLYNLSYFTDALSIMGDVTVYHHKSTDGYWKCIKLTDNYHTVYLAAVQVPEVEM